MAQAPLYNLKGETVGEVELDDAVFGIEPNRGVLHQAVVTHLRNRRQGTSDTRSRSEVSGGGKKPWRQKGTGHARQGSTRAPHWRHGGIVHGPTPRNLARSLPDKVNKLARRSALSAKLADGELKVVDRFEAEAIKTKVMVEAFTALSGGSAETTLVVLPPTREDAEALRRVYLSCRNIPHLTLCTSENLSAYDIVRCKQVYLDQSALTRIVEILRP